MIRRMFAVDLSVIGDDFVCFDTQEQADKFHEIDGSDKKYGTMIGEVIVLTPEKLRECFEAGMDFESEGDTKGFDQWLKEAMEQA